jgi:hypothetical protein
MMASLLYSLYLFEAYFSLSQAYHLSSLIITITSLFDHVIYLSIIYSYYNSHTLFDNYYVVMVLLLMISAHYDAFVRMVSSLFITGLILLMSNVIISSIF